MDRDLEQKINARAEILGAIKEELVERLQLDYEPALLDDDSYLFGAGLQLDSIDAMEIIIGIEARFGAQIPEGDVTVLRTINTLADFVHEFQA